MSEQGTRAMPDVGEGRGAGRVKSKGWHVRGEGGPPRPLHTQHAPLSLCSSVRDTKSSSVAITNASCDADTAS